MEPRYLEPDHFHVCHCRVAVEKKNFKMHLHKNIGKKLNRITIETRSEPQIENKRIELVSHEINSIFVLSYMQILYYLENEGSP